MSKVALVTGGTEGLGLQLVKDLKQHGYKVYSISRNKKKIENIKNEANDVVFFEGDISSYKDITKIYHLLDQKEGVVDVLINNAGIIYAGGIEQLEIQEWNRTFEINVGGIFIVTKIMLPLLKKSQNASIINISSISSKMTGASMAYSASKATVDMMTRSLAKELSGYNIRVNSVNPGIMDTGFQVNNNLINEIEYQNYLQSISTTYPLGIGTAENVSDLVLFLISKGAKWITGGNFVIDGGRSINV